MARKHKNAGILAAGLAGSAVGAAVGAGAALALSNKNTRKAATQLVKGMRKQTTHAAKRVAKTGQKLRERGMEMMSHTAPRHTRNGKRRHIAV